MAHRETLTKFSSLKLMSLNHLTDHFKQDCNINGSGTTTNLNHSGTMTDTTKKILSYDQESNIHAPLQINLCFPDDFTYCLNVTIGETVQAIKKRISDEFGLLQNTIMFYLDSQLMIDPLSFNDFPQITLKDSICIDVKLVGVVFNKLEIQEILDKKGIKFNENKSQQQAQQQQQQINSVIITPASNESVDIASSSQNQINNNNNSNHITSSNNSSSTNLSPILSSSPSATCSNSSKVSKSSIQETRRHSVQLDDSVHLSSPSLYDGPSLNQLLLSSPLSPHRSTPSTPISPVHNSTLTIDDNFILSSPLLPSQSSSTNNNSNNSLSPTIDARNGHVNNNSNSNSNNSNSNSNNTNSSGSNSSNHSSQNKDTLPNTNTLHPNNQPSMSHSHKKTHLRISSLCADLALTLDRDSSSSSSSNLRSNHRALNNNNNNINKGNLHTSSSNVTTSKPDEDTH